MGVKTGEELPAEIPERSWPGPVTSVIPQSAENAPTIPANHLTDHIMIGTSDNADTSIHKVDGPNVLSCLVGRSADRRAGLASEWASARSGSCRSGHAVRAGYEPDPLLQGSCSLDSHIHCLV